MSCALFVWFSPGKILHLLRQPDEILQDLVSLQGLIVNSHGQRFHVRYRKLYKSDIRRKKDSGDDRGAETCADEQQDGLR